ncbi:hypothetical protein [Anoxybacillus flavithermus]|uniref:hypothetical protein n=1 Tax=Anoxybacillus flavithermus TaxID=33934 RepID=UPI0002DBEA9E
MKDIHGLSISHQTVINYANSVALIVNLSRSLPYELSGSFGGARDVYPRQRVLALLVFYV